MTFHKVFHPENFKAALTDEWQKTREIADKVGCKNKLATQEMLKLKGVLMRWTKAYGGKTGTREWIKCTHCTESEKCTIRDDGECEYNTCPIESNRMCRIDTEKR